MSDRHGTRWRWALWPVLTMALVTMALLLILPALAAATEGEVNPQYDAQRTLAEKQARRAEIATYNERVERELEAPIAEAMLQCTRRELYSRRLYPEVILTIARDGSVVDVVPRFVNRMGVCGTNSLKGLKVAAPPTAPLYLALGTAARD